ncbi:unnamed protein product [Closterium sp. NIES-65]|nr:unnamed protein product [Closterium sp. NIES-65]
MVRPASQFWEHVIKIKDEEGNIVGATCIHCKNPVTANATTIGKHMFGTNKRDKNVAMCKSDYAKQLRATADQERSTTENATGGSTRASTSSVEAPPVRRFRQRDIRDMTDQVAHNRLDYLWAAAVAENDLAFNASKSKSIHAFVDAVIMYAKPYTLPTPYKVSGPLLDKLKADSEDLLRPLKESWKTSGCSLSVDGWTDIKSRVFVCVISQNDTAPVIVDIVDSKTAKKIGDYLATLIQGAITTVGPKHVVQVVMDNASNNKNAASKLSADYPHIFFTNCAAHCLDLMLHDIGKIPAVELVLSQVHQVVMMIKGPASFGTQVIMLGRFLEVKRALRAMVINEQWEDVAVARTEEGMEVRKLLLDDVFWDCGTAVHRLMTPIYEVLRAVDTRAQVMGQLYGLMLEATVKTNAAAETAAAHFIKRTGLLLPKDKSTFLTSIKAIIARRWDARLHNPLHAIGWLLSPRNLYIGEVRNDKEIRKGVDEVIQARGGDVQQRITLAAQVAQFHRGEGRLGSDDARWAATTLVEAGRMTEAEWWFLFGGEVQALQDLAVTSLSQPVTSEVERYWSALARVQRRDRNRLTAKKMIDVTFVAFTRRARDAFDRKAALRSKLYQDLGNGTLREGAAIIPAEVEVEEGDAEEEAPVEEECTIDWSEFGSIGKKRKGKAGKSSKGKKRGKGNGACKGKGKGKAGDAEEEEEAEESGGEEEEPALNPKGRYAWDCSDGSSGEEEEEEEEEDDEEYDGKTEGDGNGDGAWKDEEGGERDGGMVCGSGVREKGGERKGMENGLCENRLRMSRGGGGGAEEGEVGEVGVVLEVEVRGVVLGEGWGVDDVAATVEAASDVLRRAKTVQGFRQLYQEVEAAGFRQLYQEAERARVVGPMSAAWEMQAEEGDEGVEEGGKEDEAGKATGGGEGVAGMEGVVPEGSVKNGGKSECNDGNSKAGGKKRKRGK